MYNKTKIISENTMWMEFWVIAGSTTWPLKHFKIFCGEGIKHIVCYPKLVIEPNCTGLPWSLVLFLFQGSAYFSTPCAFEFVVPLCE